MSNKENNNSREVYATILNGRVDLENSAKNPLSRQEVRYYNPKSDKMQTQNYLDMQDIVVPVILRKNKNGELEFAMQYEFIPATNKVFLELPECPFFNQKQGKYDNSDVTNVVDNKMINLGLEMIGFKYLDSSETAVSQSITDQQAKFVAVYVEEERENEQLHWFPITSINDYLNNIGSNSSLQTKYALELLYKKYQEEINKKQPTRFVYDEEILGNPIGDWEDKKVIMEHKYRFGIELSENNNEDIDNRVENFGQFAEYGKSKNSANCIIVKKVGRKIEVGLAKQQRSPFVMREGVDEYFYETVGGMVEPGESFEEAAKREGVEETGLQIENLKLVHLSEPTISSKAAEEYSDYYMCEIKNSTQSNQRLDADENIEKLEWFDLNGEEIEKLHMPLAAKYLILKARKYYQKEQEKLKGEER